MPKRRLDLLLVERGLAESQHKAQALIMAGEVMVQCETASKPAGLVNAEASIELRQPPPFVSRGGVKLDHALNMFQLNVAGMVVADIGASTGGFTDCLLKRGARRVYAVDVGRGQLDYHLRQDSRVVVLEGINARYNLPISEKIDLATIDVSFISVTKVIPSAVSLLKEKGNLVVLIKPQFEAARKEVGRGGVIKDPLVHALILARFIVWAADQGFQLRGLVASPILGPAGNREFFIWLRK
jgi:23S rRNA (cytidine1920-2'-O)/16S rRNA (cytidine1409-2'-O)-methyltransferase